MFFGASVTQHVALKIHPSSVSDTSTWAALFGRARDAGAIQYHVRAFSALSGASGPPTEISGSQDPQRGKRWLPRNGVDISIGIVTLERDSAFE